MIWSVIGITALAGMGGTGLGGLISCLFRKDSSKTVSLLLSFAAGVMTSVVCFDLLTEAVRHISLSGTVEPSENAEELYGLTKKRYAMLYPALKEAFHTRA